MTTAIGPYTIHNLLGQGGMCSVRVGKHTTTHELVAVKRIQLDLPAHCYKRLDVEAAILRALWCKSPHLAQYIHYGTDTQGRNALVMELVKKSVTLGRFTLSQPDGRVAPLVALYILKCIAEGMAVAHSLGIVHRDLKTDNVLIRHTSGTIECVVVIDFGLAKADPPLHAGERLTPVPAVFGVMEYMSPEQYEDASSIDARADVYAMSLLLYYLIIGKDYYPRANRVAEEAYTTYFERTRERRCSLPKRAPDPHLPPAIWRLIRLGLSYNPSHRPKDALAFLKLLRATTRTLKRTTPKTKKLLPNNHEPIPSAPKEEPLTKQHTSSFITREQLLEVAGTAFVAAVLALLITALIFLPSSH